MIQERKLMLCAGRTTRPGWVTLDANPNVGADIVATLPDFPTEVKNIEWESMELIHGIEHFYFWEAQTLLKNIYEILAPSGTLVLEQPNLEYAARVFCGLEEPPGGFDQFCMWPIYGDPRHKDPLYSHLWGWTKKSLTEELVRAGFDSKLIVEQRPQHHFPVRDFRVVVTKTNKNWVIPAMMPG